MYNVSPWTNSVRNLHGHEAAALGTWFRELHELTETIVAVLEAAGGSRASMALDRAYLLRDHIGTAISECSQLSVQVAEALA